MKKTSKTSKEHSKAYAELAAWVLQNSTYTKAKTLVLPPLVVEKLQSYAVGDTEPTTADDFNKRSPDWPARADDYDASSQLE